MPAPEFQVQGAHEFEGALIYWWKGGCGTAPVIVKVPTRAFEDVFRRPRATDAERRRLTPRQCALLAESNLEQLARIIAKEHAAVAATGQEPQRLVLDTAAIDRSGEALSDSVLDIDAGSGWVDPISGKITRAEPA